MIGPVLDISMSLIARDKDDWQVVAGILSFAGLEASVEYMR